MKKGAGSRPPSLRHSWSLTPGEARNLQIGLRAKLRFSPLRRSPRTVAGADISHLRFGRRAVAEVVVFSFPDLERIEESLAVGEVALPYVPGLLSFREGPLLERAFGGCAAGPISSCSMARASPIRAGWASPPIWAFGWGFPLWGVPKAAFGARPPSRLMKRGLGARCERRRKRLWGASSGREKE